MLVGCLPHCSYLYMQDVDRNELILSAICKHNPTRVPSSFYLADALLMLIHSYSAKLCHGRVKHEAALVDGQKLKALTSCLRSVWRETKSSWTEASSHPCPPQNFTNDRYDRCSLNVFRVCAEPWQDLALYILQVSHRPCSQKIHLHWLCSICKVHNMALAIAILQLREPSPPAQSQGHCAVSLHLQKQSLQEERPEDPHFLEDRYDCSVYIYTILCHQRHMQDRIDIRW